MGFEVISVFDTPQQISSETTPDLLAQLLFQHLPRSQEWVSIPDEDDPTGEHWTPRWTSISEALAEVDRFLDSPAARQMEIPGFTTDELTDELRAFRDELQAASAHTTRFHLSVY